ASSVRAATPGPAAAPDRGLKWSKTPAPSKPADSANWARPTSSDHVCWCWERSTPNCMSRGAYRRGASSLPVKWVVVAVVVILVAPTIAKRLTAADANTDATATGRRRGLLYRAVRRFGLRRVGLGLTVLVVAFAVLAYLLI